MAVYAVYLDTIKLFCYLFLGILVSFCFWNFSEISCQRYFKKKISSTDPFLFLITGIWGSSGFFFLSPILHILPVPLHPPLRLLCTAFPQWDILFYIWAHSWFSSPKWEIFNDVEWQIFILRSWLFHSIIIPTLLILGSYLIQNFLYSSPAANTKVRHRLNTVFIIGIGLSVGVSAHLLGDILLYPFPGGGANLLIYRWNQQASLLWTTSHMFLGLLVPFFFIWIRNRRLKMNSIRRR